MLKAVIFDFDGVLVLSTPLHWQANQIFLKKYHKIHLSNKGGREGMRIMDIVRDYKDIYDLPGRVENLYKERQEIFYKIVDQKLELIHGTNKLLQKLKQKKLKLALATSGDKKYLNLVFAKFPKFKQFFDLVITGDEVFRGKPYPDIYLQALKKLDLKSNEAIVVEDSINGIISAKRAGISVVAIPNKYYSEADYSQADKQFENLEQFSRSILE